MFLDKFQNNSRKIKIKKEVKKMPYIVTFTTWPSTKSLEVIKQVVAANKKFPPDESLGHDLIPGNAMKASPKGFHSLTVLDVAEGKLEAAYARTIATLNFYAMAIEGFEYKTEVWATVDEAYGSIGQKPPE